MPKGVGVSMSEFIILDENENQKGIPQTEEPKEPQKKPSRLRGYIVGVLCFLRKNLQWKLLSLLVAVLVWVTIMNIDDPYITVTIPDVPVSSLNESVLQERGKISEIESGKTVTYPGIRAG